MAEGPAFTKKETEIGKASCESKQAGMRSPLEASPRYRNMSTAKPLMMMTPSSPATSISSSSFQQQQQPLMMSSCSPNITNLEVNPNSSLRSPGTLSRTGEKHSNNYASPFVYRPSALTISSDGSFTAEQSQASCTYSIPASNPNPKFRFSALNPSPYPSPNLSTAHPLLHADDRYTASPLHHMTAKNEHPTPDRSIFDPDHHVGLIPGDDQLFGGFRLLSSHASAPLFSEGLQPNWSPVITDFGLPYMTHRDAATPMSPAPEITGLVDLQDPEMSLFSTSITPRRWSLYDESSGRKGLLDTTELPSATTCAMGSGNAALRGGAQDNFRALDQSPAPYSPSLDDAHFVRKSTASVSGGGFSGGELEVMRHASPATDVSSSSASELQDNEDSTSVAEHVEAQANSDKHAEGCDAPDLGKQEADVDDKPSKKPRKKGQRRVREARVALVTKSEVEHLEDGYRWRKYGQKAVKNSPHPRSYYRCTNSKCFVKKRVERCNEDPSLVVTTYEGQHTHHSPAVLRGSHDHLLDPLMSGSLGALNYHNHAPFIPWQSPLMHPHIINTHTPSYFPTTNFSASLNQLFRPSPSAAPPSFLLTKPLSFTSTSLPLPTSLDHSTSLPRNISMHPTQLQAAGGLPPMPTRPHHVVQITSTAAHDQAPLSSPTLQLFNSPRPSSRQAVSYTSSALPASHVDKGLLDDMLSHASPGKPPTSASS